MTGSIETQVRQWIDDYVAAQLQHDQVVALANRLNATIMELVPDVADDELRRDLHASTIAQLRLFLAGLSNNVIPTQPPDEAHALARTLARRGHDLRVLMRVYQAGQHAANEYLMERAASENLPPELERALVRRLLDSATAVLGAALEKLVDTYTEERDIGFRGTLIRRAETVRSVLSGGALDLEAASRQLGYRLSGKHIACVLWSDANFGEGDVAGILERVANRIALSISGVRPMTVPSGAHGLWAWIPVDKTPDLRALSTTNPGPEEAAVRVAFGGWATGVDGFRRSHREALAARQVAQSTASTHWLTDYLDVELIHLVAADPDGMRALISRELSGIAGRDPSSERLRATLSAYLDHHCSASAAAQALGIHKNTVRYRMQRIEELLGHSIDAHRLSIEVALACFRAYPRTVP